MSNGIIDDILTNNRIQLMGTGKSWKLQAKDSGSTNEPIHTPLPTPSRSATLSKNTTDVSLSGPSRLDNQVAVERTTANVPVPRRSARQMAKSSKVLSSGPLQSGRQGATEGTSANIPAAQSITRPKPKSTKVWPLRSDHQVAEENGANKLVLPRRTGRLEAYSTKVSSSGPAWSHHQTVTKDTSADKPLHTTSKKSSTISHKRSLGAESADDGRESSSKRPRKPHKSEDIKLTNRVNTRLVTQPIGKGLLDAPSLTACITIIRDAIKG